jgi:PAS domain S-box-containing protein
LTAAEVLRLPADKASLALPVRLRAVVTYFNRELGTLFLHDSSGGVFAQPPPELAALEPGDEVDVLGVSAPGSAHSILEAKSVTRRTGGRLPKALALNFEKISDGVYDAEWVSAKGVVLRAVEFHEYVDLVVGVNSWRLKATVLNPSRNTPERLLGAKISVQGALSMDGDKNSRTLRGTLLVPAFRFVEIEEPGPANPFALPSQSISSLLAKASDTGFPLLIKTSGRITEHLQDGRVTVSDGTGRLAVLTAEPVDLLDGTSVEVAGFLGREFGEPQLDAALVRLAGDPGALQSGGLPAQTNRPLTTLTTALEIHSLGEKDADRGFPVRLSGVITYYDPMWGNMFVQDSTGGIYVDAPGGQTNLAAGQIVEVEGVTDAGEFAPIVSRPRFKAEGPGKMPEASVVNFDRMKSGKYDSQWVEAEGVVHSASNYLGHSVLSISAEGGSFAVTIPNPADLPAPENLVNASVRLQGACGALFNKNRQIIGVELLVPDLSRIVRDANESTDPFAQPVQPVRELLQFHPRHEPARMARVHGVVTLKLKNGRFFVQDAGGGLLLKPDRPQEIALGDEVDAAGFPAAGDYSPVLENAKARSRGPGPPVVPVSPETRLILSADPSVATYDGRLIRARGTLLRRLPSSADEILILQDGPWIFQAVLEKNPGEDPLRDLRPNSILDLTGVCSVQVDESLAPTGFRLRLRSASDVAVVQAAPWWTPAHTLVLSAALLSVILGATGWAFALRRRVAVQTELIRSRLEREAALEKRFLALIEHAADAIIVHDIAGKLLMVNESACESLGYTRAELLARTLAEIQVNFAATNSPSIWQAMTPGKPLSFTGFHRRKDGSEFPVEIRLGVIDEAGQRVCVAVARDLTDRQNLEAQLRQAQKMESVGQLAGGVAHDFNNILTVIHGHADLLSQGENVSEAARESITEIAESSARAANLTRQLLAFSRRQRMQTQDLDLNDVIANLTKMLQRLIGEDIELELRGAGNLPIVHADVGMIEQVILNLAVNARDAMPNGGKLSIGAKAVWIDADYTQRNPESAPGLAVVLEVTDTGSGIAPENLGRVFEPFFTTKDVGKGTGLGLATVYGIVKQHSGWIKVSSQIGRGACFQVFLPASRKPLADVAPEPSESPRRGGTETILVVEDEKALREMVVKSLSASGYKVYSAASGALAREVWRSHREEIDLLLTDIVMPGGVSGLDLGRELAGEKPSLRVIYTSGYSAAVVGKDCVLQQGINYLQKPCLPRDVAKAIRECLDQPAAR